MVKTMLALAKMQFKDYNIYKSNFYLFTLNSPYNTKYSEEQLFLFTILYVLYIFMCTSMDIVQL